MLQLSDKGIAKPDDDGWLTFTGNPYELQVGDVVLDGQYAVMRPPVRAEHNKQPAIMLVLAEAQEFQYETNYLNGEPTERGRVTLLRDSWLTFDRQVTNFDFGQEGELHSDFLDDSGYEDYNHEWRGQCVDVPKGLVVVFGEKAEVKVVDSVYPNGAVLFEDGSVYQSHPNREWIGWLNEPANVLHMMGSS